MEVARSVASRYFERGIEDDDLVQVAYAALTRAARDFDPGRHKDFLSYAVPTIRGELKKHFRDLGWAVRPPRRIQETQSRITRAEVPWSRSSDDPPAPRRSPNTSGSTSTTWSRPCPPTAASRRRRSIVR